MMDNHTDTPAMLDSCTESFFNNPTASEAKRLADWLVDYRADGMISHERMMAGFREIAGRLPSPSATDKGAQPAPSSAEVLGGPNIYEVSSHVAFDIAVECANQGEAAAAWTAMIQALDAPLKAAVCTYNEAQQAQDGPHAILMAFFTVEDAPVVDVADPANYPVDDEPGDCEACGIDLASPSADGAEDGMCGSCIADMVDPPETVPIALRTDREIVDQANALAIRFAQQTWGFAFQEGAKLYNAADPRLQNAWRMACTAFDQLQATPADEALENLRDAGEEPTEPELKESFVAALTPAKPRKGQ